MTADRGNAAQQGAETPRSAGAAPAAEAALDFARWRRALAGEDALQDVLQSKEEEFRKLLKDSNTPFEERRAAKAEREAVAWLAENWPHVQHNARALRDFAHWRETPPARAKLFAAFCRHALPVEWDRYLADGEPPFVFPSREKFRAHLAHCQLCDAQRQLAEGRRRRIAPDRPTWSDRLLRDFLNAFCREALAAVCDPDPDLRPRGAGEARTWSEAPPWRLIVPADARPAARDALQTELRLRLLGPPQPARLELLVAAQFLARATRQPESPVVVYPAERGGEPIFDWRPTGAGVQEFPLRLPAPAEPGRFLLRYAVRPAPAAPAGNAALPASADRPVGSETFVDAVTWDG